MNVAKIIPTSVKAIPVATMLVLGAGAVASAQTNNINEAVHEITVSDQETEKKTSQENPVSWDVALRTFQFLDGNNMSCVSTGVGKNWNNLSGYFTVMGGYHTGSMLPMVGTMGYFDYKYPNQNNKINLSAELYHESGLNKNGLSQKVAITPIKSSFQLCNKANLCIDPRMAVCLASGQAIPKFEVLATLSAKIYKDFYGYAIGQIYDVSKPSNPSNYSVNLGLIKYLPCNKRSGKLHRFFRNFS